MNRKYLSTLSIAFALVLAAACSDDKKPTRDAGIDATTGPAMCMGTFAALNRNQLMAVAKPGMCSSPADLDVICSQDVGTVMRNCGGSCYLANPARTDLVACTITCAKMTLAASPSDPCLTCYGGTVTCTLTNCKDPCGAAPTGPACLKCQNDNNCLAPFFACSGLPAPPAPTTDGGATPMGDAAPAAEGGTPSGDGGVGDKAPSGDAATADKAATPDGGAADTAGATDAAVDAAVNSDAPPATDVAVAADVAADDTAAVTADAAASDAAATD